MRLNDYASASEKRRHFEIVSNVTYEDTAPDPDQRHLVGPSKFLSIIKQPCSKVVLHEQLGRTIYPQSYPYRNGFAGSSNNVAPG